MIKILFVCLGNICRSPMTEFMMKDLVKKSGLKNEFYIASAGTSDEEEGNSVHSGTKSVLNRLHIDCSAKTAVKMTSDDYKKYDYIIAMEENNVRGARKIAGGDPKQKICRLLDFSENPRDIADPWYTGNFESTYQDIKEGCEDLLLHIINNGELYQ